MSDGISVTFEDLAVLAQKAHQIGHHLEFGRVALQWAKGANEEITRLRAEVERLTAERDALRAAEGDVVEIIRAYET